MGGIALACQRYAALRQRGGTLRIPQGMAPLGEDGTVGELVEPPEVDGQGAAMEMRTTSSGAGSFSMSSGPSAPFTPRYAWTMAPDGDWVVGTGDSYRFEIHHAAGGRAPVTASPAARTTTAHRPSPPAAAAAS